MNNLVIRKKQYLSILTVIVFTMLPWYNILLRKDNIWQLKQPEFYEGGLEVIVFGITSYFILLNERLHKYLKYVIILYLSLQGIIIPVAIVYFFFEIIRYMGFAFLKTETNILSEFNVGLIMWLACCVIMSLAKFGTIEFLRIAFAVLFIICFVISHKDGKNREYVIMLKKLSEYIREDGQDKKLLFLKVFAIFFTLMLFAKTNEAIDFDSMWYGLRPEFVLVGKNSFYDYLGYASFVYYYPKLWELIFLPISKLGDYSFLISANIYIYILFMYGFYDLTKMMTSKKVNKLYIMGITISVFCIPAVTNIAVTAKPDILGAFLSFSAFSYLIKWIIERRNLDLTLFFCCIILSTGTKLTYVLWVGIMFIYAIICIIYMFKPKISFSLIKSFIIRKINCRIMIMAIIGTVGVHYRTLKLTGYPLYPMFLGVSKKLGFNGLYTFKTSEFKIRVANMNLSQIIERLYRLVIDPNNILRIVTMWTSNLLLVLALVWYINRIKRKKHWSDEVFLILGIPQFLAMIRYMVSIDDPDGNFFIFPIILLCFMFSINLIKIFEVKNDLFDKKMAFIALIIIIVTNGTIAFATHSSRHIGTKAFDLNFLKNNFETYNRNQEIYKVEGISRITEFLEKDFQNRRVLSYVDNLTVAYRIKGQIETSFTLESDYLSSDKLTESYNEFCAYLKYARIEGVILSKGDKSKTENYVWQLINEKGYRRKVEDDKAIFYELIL